MKSLSIFTAILGIGLALPAATLTSGYSTGSGLLGEAVILDNAATGGGDSTAAEGDLGWVAEATGLWISNAPITLTGIALPIWSNDSDSGTTVSGTFTFSFYELDNGADPNAFDGVAVETLLGTATATFIQGAVSTYYTIFDSPISFISRSKGVAVRITNTGALRLKVASAANAPGVVRKDTNTGAPIGGSYPNFRWSLAGTAPALPGTVADYQDNYRGGGFPSGWRYLWNKPNGWPSSSNNRTGTIGDPSSYAPLQPSGTNYTPDGDANYANNSPAGYLRLSSGGGHVGNAGGAAGARDRFAIAAYTVSSGGFYKLTKTRFRPSTEGTVLQLVAHVDSNPFLFDVMASGSALRRFDTLLGWLNAGQTIYVGVGPAGNSAYGSFTLDFTVETYDPETTTILPQLATRYSRAIIGGADHTNGWAFLWNAPEGWMAGVPSGDLATGRISSSSSYRPLLRAGNSFTPDGDLNDENNTPANGLYFDPAGGRPGAAGYHGAMSRYAIAQYSVPVAGKYLIGQSFLELSPDSEDGVEVMVLVNGIRQYTQTVQPGRRGSFEGELGPLTAGDQIQVAVGPRGNDTGDDFVWDYEITYATSYFDETTQVIDVASYGAMGDGKDDGPAIRSAIADAISSGAPTIIDFDGTKVYRVTSYVGDFAIHMTDCRNIWLRGNGATISIRPPKRSVYIDRADNIRLEGLTFICDPLPYFQADIVGYNKSAGTLDIKVWTNYPMPKVDAPDVSNNGSTWAFGQRFGNKAGHFWIKTVKEIDPENTANRILRVTARTESFNSVEDAGQNSRGIIIATPGQGQMGNFIMKIKDSSHVHFKDSVVRNAPEFIVLPYGNRGPIRFDNFDMRVPPGTQERLVSWRDGFHVKNNRYGPIWEDCEFDGWAMQDDLFNNTADWGYVNTILGSNPRMLIVNFAGSEGDPWRTGDWVTAQQLNGNSKGSARILYCVANGGKFYIELAREIPGLSTGDRLINDQASNRGSIIRRCRTYGGDAGTSTWRQRSPLLVEDNYFSDFYMWINAEGSAEGPVPEDIVIRRNTFKGAGRFIDTGYDSGSRATRNIRYFDNLFDRPTVGLRLAYDVLFACNNFIVQGSDIAVGMNDAGPATFVGNAVNGVVPGNFLPYVNRVGGTTSSDVIQRNALDLSAQLTPDGQIALEWTPGPGATNYNVLRAPSSAGPYELVEAVRLDTAYLDSVPSGALYFYRIQSVNTNGLMSATVPISIALPANTPPVVGPIPDYTVSPGMTLRSVISATDTNTPPRALTFTLLKGPAGAAIDSTNGVFTWTPNELDANTTRQVVVEISNDGTPPLSVSRSFLVHVIGLGEPAWLSFQAGGLRMNGSVMDQGYGSRDIHILNTSPALSDTTTLISGNQYNSGGARIHRNLLAFDLSALAEAAGGHAFSVQEVRLTMTNHWIRMGSGINGIPQNIHLTDPFADGANWNTRNGATAWPTPGGTVGELLSSLTISEMGTHSWPSSESFIAAVSAALESPDHTLYLLLKGGFDSNQDNRSQFRNSQWTTLSERPRLDVRFSVDLPIPPVLSWQIVDGMLEVSWPSNYTDYVLQAQFPDTRNGLSPGAWTNVTGVVDNRYLVAPNGGSAFFRLKQDL